MSSYRLVFCVLFIVQVGFTQSNNLTSSPYSLFGLGVDSNSNTGINSGMGRSGIALESTETINLYNPASLASLENDRIILDFGMYTEIQNVSSDDGDELRFASNFSNVALAFSIGQSSKAALSLIPSTNVGYALIGVETNIEGSTEQFTSNVFGSGGLNELRLDYANRFFNKLDVGLKFSYLFGTIEENESVTTSESLLAINEINYYGAFRFGFGLQYQIFNDYNLGFVMNLPTSLKGKRDTFVQKSTNTAFTVLEETSDETIDSFEYPIEIGFGISKRWKSLLLTTDYTFKSWSSTSQSDTLGDYVDQNIVSLGAEYTIDSESYKYWKRVNFRAGLNYNSGYLEIDDTKVSSFDASFGIGIPIGKRGKSLLNVSYTIGNRGTTDSFLVEENYSTLNVNLTLTDIWFQKKKYN
ncbi:hypothetical protein [Winogradskyella sp.]|uniref:hypothetical protein n=1 Tax=Winogradskyella sp. TaxID=1883156 RepID=UPI0026102035|nr:hypothetical protein [Winogradskyella sp.]